ncbi:hypothetical protein Q5M85_22890 [Paraclostridium bifermentans]|nr:hypothetical protein [Paraclostridium bifermentans]
MLHTVVKLGFGKKIKYHKFTLRLNDTEREKQLKEVESLLKT